MRVTIVPVDGVVGVDGEFRKVAGLAEMYPNVHAIQWGEQGEYGHVELSDGSPNNVNITLADLQPALDAWTALTPPAPTSTELLDSAKVRGIDLMNRAYEAVLYADIAYNGYVFQADADSQDVMVKALTTLNGGNPTGWQTADNQFIPITNADLLGLVSAIFNRGQTAFIQRSARKTAVRAATTVAEVEGVVW